MAPSTMFDIPRTAHRAPTITLFGPAECPNCDKAMKLFDRHGIPHTKVTIEAGDENHRHITQDLGYTQAPVIVLEFDPDEHHPSVHWGGHRQDMLTAVVRLFTQGLGGDVDAVTSKDNNSAA